MKRHIFNVALLILGTLIGLVYIYLMMYILPVSDVSFVVIAGGYLAIQYFILKNAKTK
jgi:hypothetical protein